MKKLILAIAFMLSAYHINAQEIGWQYKDHTEDGIYGISKLKAVEALKNNKAKKVIIAIINTGIDTLHSELKPVLWTDTKTKIHGWNYIGAETGREDVTLIAADKKDLYDSLAIVGVPEKYREGYQRYRKVAPILPVKIQEMQELIKKLTAQGTPAALELKKKVEFHIAHGLNVDNLEADTAKGNSDVTPDPIAVQHIYPAFGGTHVAGIIGGVKYGVADNVELMMLKAIGNIREPRDRSLASAIRFAVDHGAKVINFSPANSFTWVKHEVDDAIAYANKSDVLIIHSAGISNFGNNNDISPIYPRPEDRSNWIVVGASDQKGNPLGFSNFGLTQVDIFAPGIAIYSSIPGDRFSPLSGTTMSAAIVAGVAAKIRGHFPALSAEQVKNIILASSVKRESLSDKCTSGGIVNLYDAVKLAQVAKGKK